MNFGRRKLIKMTATGMAAPLFMPHIARAATKKLRIGHNNSTTSALQLAAVQFQQYVRDKTGSRYDIDIYPNSQLGGDFQLVRAVSDGTLDMTICATAILGIYGQDLELVEIPYLFNDTESARKAMDGNLGAHYTEILSKSSLTAIGWGENGLRHVTANKPIRNVADIKDLKIRVQPAKIQVESFRGFGAAAEPLAFNELPEALRTGRFEAQENPINIVTANDFILKNQTHLSLTSHVYSPFAVLFAADVLEDMPVADRAVIQAGGAVAAKFTRDYNDKTVVTAIDQVKAAGMIVVTDVDRRSFQKAMEGLTDRLAVAAGGAEAISRVRGLIA